MMKPQIFSETPTPAEAFNPEAVGNGEDDEEGQADKKILHGKGDSQGKDPFDCFLMEGDMGPRHCKGQGPVGDEVIGNKDADGLGEDRCQGRAGGTKRKDGDHKEVKNDV